MLRYILSLISSYLFGSIPSGYLVSKYRFNKNIPIIDGQMGTKHIYKHVGIKASALTFVFDFLKGYIPIRAIIQILPEAYWVQGMSVIAVILGHNYSVFLDFKGGKGIASSMGCFAVYPAMLPVIALTHYLANELCKNRAIYGLIPLAVVSFSTYDPFSLFLVPLPVKISAILIILLFIIKTFEDPMFIQLRENHSTKTAP